jgi:hypothetical protein
MFVDPIILSILVRKTFICKQVPSRIVLRLRASCVTMKLQGMSEDVDQPSAWDASKKMRENMFGILHFFLFRRKPDFRLPAMLFFSVPLNLSKNSAVRLPPLLPSLSLHATPTPAATRSLPLPPLKAPRLLREQPG